MYGPGYIEKVNNYFASPVYASEETRQRQAGWKLGRDVPRRHSPKFTSGGALIVNTGRGSYNKRANALQVLQQRRRIARSRGGGQGATARVYARQFLAGYSGYLREVRSRNAKAQARNWRGRFE